MIISLVMQKQRLMEKYLLLTAEQAEAINKDDYDSVLDTINRKQQIIEQVNLLNLNIENHRDKVGGLAEAMNDETRELISKAILIDKNNRALLKKRQVQILEKLKHVRQNRATHALYRGKNINMEGILLDQRK